MTDRGRRAGRAARMGAVVALLGLAVGGCSKPVAGPDAADAAGAVADLPAGLEIEIVRPGDGPAVAPGDTAVMHYTGWLYDEGAADGRGQKFDSSRDADRTFVFPVGAGRVIRGWDLGVPGMQVGEVRVLRIEPELAYGSRGAGGVIPPDATLIFEVELVGIQ